MKIVFIKNIQFTKLVKADGRLREFNFRKVNGMEKEMFTVDVNDDRNNRKIFSMQKEDTGWKIVTPEQLPDWIGKNEQVLSDLIDEELKII